jgi:hypothetical protein
MESWEGWEIGRWVVLLASIFYLGVWLQLALYHWGAAFRRWEMIPPVIATPLIALAGLLGVVQGDGAFGWIAAAAFAVGVLEGLVGLFFHLQGTSSMVGGFSLRNFIAGPPPLLPVAYSLIGVFGLAGLLLND